MKLSTHNISKRLIEVSVDEVNSGTLNAKEARELAIHLIEVANELLHVEEVKQVTNKDRYKRIINSLRSV